MVGISRPARPGDSSPRGIPGRRTSRPLAVLLAALLLVALGPFAGVAAAAVDTEPPTTPGPIEVAGYGTNSVVLTWAASTDNVGVARYEVSQFYSDVAVLWRTPTNSITITGVAPSRTYRFSVRAVDEAGNSSSSPPQFRLTMPPGDDQPPTAPSGLTVSRVSDTTVGLNWSPSSDNIFVAFYEVLSITPSGSTVVGYRPQHPPIMPGTGLEVTRLTPGTTYTLAVRAGDDAGNYSALSVPVVVTTRVAGPDVTPPSAPGTPVPSDLGPSGVNLGWAPATDDSAQVTYEVVDQAAPGGPARVAVTSYDQVRLGLVPGRAYVFVVYAVDPAGNRSPASGALSVTAPSACRVDYQVLSRWPGGFRADVRIRNTTATAVDGWTLDWTWPTGTRIQSVWNAVPVSAVGPAVAVRDANWNARIPADGTVSFGFVASSTGAGSAATDFVLNDLPCGA